jgi:hypothetical protein
MNFYSQFLNQKVHHDCNRYNLSRSLDIMNFNVLYVNINRLVSERRRESFDFYLRSLNFMPDAIILVETFFTSLENALQIKHYNSYHSIQKGWVEVFQFTSSTPNKVFFKTN